MVNGKYIIPFRGRLLLALAVVFAGCVPDYVQTAEGGDSNVSLGFGTKSTDSELVGNAKVYMFDGGNTSAVYGQFYKQLVGITRDDASLTLLASVETGKWQFAVVTGSAPAVAGVINPVAGSARSALKMWETQPSGGELPSMPDDFYYDITDVTTITANANVTATADLKRPVAQVQVCMTGADGFKTTALGGTHTVEFTNVPTTLDWDGRLYPTNNGPDVSNYPMTGTLTISDNDGSDPSITDVQVSNTISFYMPAPIEESDADTTTNKLMMSITLTQRDGSLFVGDAQEVKHVPRANKILRISVSASGSIVNYALLPWDDVDFDGSDDSRYGLSVSESDIFLTKEETYSGIYVTATYAGSPTGKDAGVTVTADSEWLEVTDAGGVAIGSSATMLADAVAAGKAFGYRAEENDTGTTRTGSITLKWGNITKTINITQYSHSYTATTQDAANCYMVQPSGEAAKFPIYANDGSNWRGSTVLGAAATNPLQAGFLWTDNKYGLSNKSVVHKILIDGTRNNIIVIPGPATGNAMVSVTDAAGDIGWSWHIWNTDYVPGGKSSASASGGELHQYAGNAFLTGGNYAGKYIMDRNLGATWTAADGLPIGNTMTGATVSAATATKAYGLYYQWGRKDPFPGADGTTINGWSAGAATIYNGSATVLTEGGATATGIKKVMLLPDSWWNLGNAVANPMTFYYSSYNSFDWYTIGWGSWKNDLWQVTGSGNTKTIYDPCPPGWKVPAVASNVDVASAAAYNPWAGFNGMGADDIRNIRYNMNGISVHAINDVVLTDSEYTVVVDTAIFKFWPVISGASGMYGGLEDNNNNASNGRLYFGVSGYKVWYPASGARSCQSGDICTVGFQGSAWTASAVPGVDAAGAYRMFFTCQKSNPTYDAFRADGLTLRCVQEH